VTSFDQRPEEEAREKMK
jgi:hypothetical protein